VDASARSPFLLCGHLLLCGAGSASVPLVFLLRGMLRWDGPVGGP
jgi:hypothetical protein